MCEYNANNANFCTLFVIIVTEFSDLYRMHMLGILWKPFTAVRLG